MYSYLALVQDDPTVQVVNMGWLPSAPQLNLNPLHVKARADAAGMSERILYNGIKRGE